MNILYIMRYWPVYGGGETVTVTLANEFVNRGHNVFIAYTYYNTCDPMPYEIANSIQSICLNTIEAYKLSDVLSLHNYILKNDIDVMINQWGSTALCNEARNKTKCKLITCWHLDLLREVVKPKDLKKRILYRLVGWKLFQQFSFAQQMKEHDKNCRLSDRYIFLSKAFSNDYLQKTEEKLSVKKVDAIPNPLTYNGGYNIDHYSLKKKQVLFVGRIFEYHKRLSYVLNIWKKIEEDKTLQDWSLMIVGDGPDMQMTKDLVVSLDLKRTSFVGFRNPQSYYEESAVFMMTSAFEGFGMTLVEAQQYAVVPMAMDTYGSLHDIIKNEENGIIIPDNDLDEYVHCLKKLIRNDDYRCKLAMNGLTSCRKFSIDNICDSWIRLFDELK